MHRLSTARRAVMAGCEALLITIATTAALAAQRPDSLPIGSTTDGITASSSFAAFVFKAPSAGILMVAIRASVETDLVLFVTDDYGQTLPDGKSDQDLGGNAGHEQVAVVLPRSGSYFVSVRPYDQGGGQFSIGGAWLAWPDLERDIDLDGSPGSANPITAGTTTARDTINPSRGDHWDWYSITIRESGLLTVVTRASQGDLVLEAFIEGEYGEATQRSDQDLQEVMGNEAITLVVTQGQTLYFKVYAFSSSGDAVTYRLSAVVIPD